MRPLMRAAGALALALAVSGVRAAEPGGDFYKGAVVSIVVGYGPGGGYDQAARVLANIIRASFPVSRA